MLLVPQVLVEVPANLLAGHDDNSFCESVASQYFHIVLTVHMVQMLLVALVAEESYRASMHRALVLSVGEKHLPRHLNVYIEDGAHRMCRCMLNRDTNFILHLSHFTVLSGLLIYQKKVI